MGIRSCFRYVGSAVPVVCITLTAVLLSPAAAPPVAALSGGGWATAVPAPCTTPCTFTADNLGGGLDGFPVGAAANEHAAWFLVDVPAITAYTLRASTGGTWHATLVLTDLDGAVLAADDDPAGRDPAVTAYLSAGTYVVALAGHAATDTGTASLSIAMGTPDVPADVTADAGDASLTVHWTAPDDHGDAVTEYHVYLDGGTDALVVPGTDTTVDVPDVVVGHSYTAQVTAVNGHGESARSASTLAAVPYSGTTTTVSFEPATVTWPATFTVTVTVTGLFPVSEGKVVFSKNGTKVAEAAVTDGVASLTGQSLAPGNYTFHAAYSGTATFLASSQFKSITVAKAAQTITFDAMADTAIGAGAVTVAASSSSGLTVTVGSLTSGVCTVRTRTVTLLATGTCTLTATQAGNAYYAAAPTVQRSFVVTDNPTTTTTSTTTTTTEPPTTTTSTEPPTSTTTTSTTTTSTTTTTEPPATTTSSTSTTTTTEPPTTEAPTTEPPTTAGTSTTSSTSTSTTTTEPVTEPGTSTTSSTSTTTSTTQPVTESGTSSSSSSSSTSSTTTSSTVPPATPTSAVPTTVPDASPAITTFAAVTVAGPSVLTAGRTVAVTVVGTRVPAKGVAAVAVVLGISNATGTGRVVVSACTATDGPTVAVVAGAATRLTALVPLVNGDGRVCVRTTATIAFRLEVTGWAATGGSYHAAPATPALWSGTMTAGTHRVQVVGRAGIAAGTKVQSVMVHVLVTGATGATSVSAGACGGRAAAVLEVAAASSAANFAVLPVDATGAVCVTVNRAAPVRVVLEGWTTSGAFHPTATRLLDTRRGTTLAPGTTLQVPVPAAVRTGAAWVSVAVVTSGADGSGAVRIGSCGATAAATATVNPRAATSTATVLAFRTGGSVLCVSTTRRTHVVIDLTGWFDAAR